MEVVCLMGIVENVSMQCLLHATKNRPHGNSTLYDHLVGTQRILNAWSCPRIVHLAGLFHSIYSTQHYPYGLFSTDKRSALASVLGEEPERLVYMFCTVDRDELWSKLDYGAFPNRVIASSVVSDGEIILDKADLTRLAFIELANTVEQSYSGNGLPGIWMHETLVKLEKLGHNHFRSPLLSAKEWSEAQENIACIAYRSFLDAGGKDRSKLEVAFESNCFSGELHLFSSLFSIIDRNRSEATRLAGRSQELFQFWGSAWDRRLDLDTWLAVADHVTSSSDDFEAESAAALISALSCGILKSEVHSTRS